MLVLSIYVYKNKKAHTQVVLLYKLLNRQFNYSNVEIIFQTIKLKTANLYIYVELGMKLLLCSCKNRDFADLTYSILVIFCHASSFFL